MAHSGISEGTITSPSGFRATGIHAGLKTTRDRDLGLLIARNACTAAVHMGASSGTTGAWSTANVRRNAADIRAVLVLTGVACGRGAEAIVACDALAALLADEAAITPQNVILLAGGAETPFDMDVLRRGVARGLDELDSKGGRRLALALATTNQTAHMTAIQVELAAGQSVILGGLATSGDLARVIITTNANVPAKLLNTALDAVLSQYPDLDQSAIVLLANGSADAPACVYADDAPFAAWQTGLLALVGELM